MKPIKQVLSWFGAQTLLGRRTSRKLCNHTYLEKDGNDYCVRLYNTRVLRFHQDNTVTINTGGWNTVTTFARIRRYAGLSISRNLLESGMRFRLNESDGLPINYEKFLAADIRQPFQERWKKCRLFLARRKVSITDYEGSKFSLMDNGETHQFLCAGWFVPLPVTKRVALQIIWPKLSRVQQLRLTQAALQGHQAAQEMIKVNHA